MWLYVLLLITGLLVPCDSSGGEDSGESDFEGSEGDVVQYQISKLVSSYAVRPYRPKACKLSFALYIPWGNTPPTETVV